MTRKHFILIAEALGLITNEQERKKVAEYISSVCQEQNDLFDKQKFLDHIEWRAS
jgi:hypothetical protein